MKLPATAVIGHRNYTLEMWPWAEAAAESARGIHYDRTHRIKVADDLSEADQGEVLIHEILHACWRGLPLNDEERIVTTIAENLAQVFADNPKIIDWLKEKLTRPTAALRVKTVLKPLKPKQKDLGFTITWPDK